MYPQGQGQKKGEGIRDRCTDLDPQNTQGGNEEEKQGDEIARPVPKEEAHRLNNIHKGETHPHRGDGARAEGNTVSALYNAGK
jgi:hypothetical protein